MKMIESVMQQYLLYLLNFNALVRFLPKIISIKSLAESMWFCLLSMIVNKQAWYNLAHFCSAKYDEKPVCLWLIFHVISCIWSHRMFIWANCWCVQGNFSNTNWDAWVSCLDSKPDLKGTHQMDQFLSSLCEYWFHMDAHWKV